MYSLLAVGAENIKSQTGQSNRYWDLVFTGNSRFNRVPIKSVVAVTKLYLLTFISH